MVEIKSKFPILKLLYNSPIEEYKFIVIFSSVKSLFLFHQLVFLTKVIPVTTKEYGVSIASRPFNSRLEKSKLSDVGFKRLPTWQDAVERYIKEESLWDKLK